MNEGLVGGHASISAIGWLYIKQAHIHEDEALLRPRSAARGRGRGRGGPRTKIGRCQYQSTTRRATRDPDATPENLEKWKFPSCFECNQRYSKIEGDLLNRVVLALDTKNPASAGLVDAALRAMDPNAGRDEKDAAARAARGRKILKDTFKGEEIPREAMLPGLGERWGRSESEQMAVQIPRSHFTDVTEKIVRGLVYREDGGFIKTPYKIDTYVVDDEGAKVVKDMLDKSGKEFKREPGLEIRRASLEGDDHAGLYEITFWQQFKTYAIVKKAEDPAVGPTAAVSKTEADGKD